MDETKRRAAIRWVAGGALFVAAACSPEGVSDQTLFGPEIAPAVVEGPLALQVRLCKISNDNEFVGESFDFTVSASPGGEYVEQAEPTIEAGDNTLEGAPCEVVWSRPETSFDDESMITITELLPTGYALETIAVSRVGGDIVIDDPTEPSLTFAPLGGATVYFKQVRTDDPPPPPPPSGDEGCTPGYWKVSQHHDSWEPTGYTTGQTVGSVFANASPYAGTTLVDALGFGGGPGINGAKKILLRAAVAALLNASHPDVAYPRSAADVIADVSAALAGSRDTMLALASELDEDNNLGCPLN